MNAHQRREAKAARRRNRIKKGRRPRRVGVMQAAAQAHVGTHNLYNLWTRKGKLEHFKGGQVPLSKMDEMGLLG